MKHRQYQLKVLCNVASVHYNALNPSNVSQNHPRDLNKHFSEDQLTNWRSMATLSEPAKAA